MMADYEVLTLKSVDLNMLEWNDYTSEHDVPYREAYLDDLLEPHLLWEADISVTLRRYPVRYFLAYEEFEGDDYTQDGDGCGLVPGVVCAWIFGKYRHADFENNAVAILNALIHRLNGTSPDVYTEQERHDNFIGR